MEKTKFKDRLKALLVLALPPLASFTFAGLTEDAFLTNIANFTGIVTLVPILAQTIKNKWNLASVTIFWNIKVMKLITWSLALGLTALSWFVGWGFVDFAYYEVAAYGIGAGLVANEYFTLATVKLLLQLIFKK